MDHGERILWQGAQDPARAVRRWILDSFAVYGPAAVGLVLFAVMTPDVAEPWALGSYLPLIAALFGLVFLAIQGSGVIRRARTTTYVLTDRRLIIDRPSGRTELRLANLPDLRLDRAVDGFGSIYFAMPAGSGPNRYVRRWQRALGGQDSTELLGPVSGVQRAFELMVDAQAHPPVPSPGPAGWMSSAPNDTLAGPPTHDGEPSPRPRQVVGPGTAPTAPVVEPETPVERLSFTESAATVPLWFSLPFLVIGLGLMTAGVIGGLASGGFAIVLLGGLFAVLGGALVRGHLRHERARRRLVRIGLRLDGEVLELAATGIQVNNQEQWIVRYRYEVHGWSLTGHSPPVPWGQAARWAAGDPISLLVDPDDPSTSVIADLEV